MSENHEVLGGNELRREVKKSAVKGIIVPGRKKKKKEKKKKKKKNSKQHLEQREKSLCRRLREGF